MVLALSAFAGSVFRLSFGALAAAAVYLALFFLNRALLRKGIEPEYRENDPADSDMDKTTLLLKLDANKAPSINPVPEALSNPKQAIPFPPRSHAPPPRSCFFATM